MGSPFDVINIRYLQLLIQSLCCMTQTVHLGCRMTLNFLLVNEDSESVLLLHSDILPIHAGINMCLMD